MSRGIAANNSTEATSPVALPVTFVKLEFDSVNGVQYVHNSLGTITWGGNDWLGVGDLGEIGVIQEGEEVSPYKLTLTLSGLDATIMDETTNQNYYGRPVSIYVGFLLQDTHVLTADPDLYWSGKIDAMAANLGSVNSVQLTAESDLAIFDKANGALYTDSNLQEEFPGDLFFQYLPQIKDLKLRWSGETKFFNGGSHGFGPSFGGGSDSFRGRRQF